MKKRISIVLLLLLAAVFLGVILLLAGLGNGQGWTGMVRDYQDLYARTVGRYIGSGRITMDRWPSFDPAYRLDPEGEVTEEDIAYYIATKLPDECKNEDTLIYDVKVFDAVIVAENPAYDGQFSAEHPLWEPDAIRFDREAIGVDARIVLMFGTDKGEIVPGDGEKQAFDAVWDALLQAFPEESGFVWRRLELSATINNSFPIEGSMDQWRTVPLAEYTKVFPDFEGRSTP